MVTYELIKPTFWAKLYQAQCSRIRIDVKPVLPRSELLRKFRSTYATLRSRVDYLTRNHTCSGGGIL